MYAGRLIVCQRKDPYGSTLARGPNASRSGHCRCGDPKPTNTTVTSHTSKLAAFNVLPTQLRLGRRLDCQPPIRLSTRLPLNGFTYFELSLQSSFQLSLTVLVRYRTRDRI
jgi:hypothetical protein